MINFSDPNFWVISALVFLLGLLAGMWMTAGGRRKWRGRYKEEATRREGLEDELKRCRQEWDAKEKEWRERDSLRRIQMIYQMADTAVNPRHRVSDIIGRPAELYLGLKGRAREQRVLELLALTELDEIKR